MMNPLEGQQNYLNFLIFSPLVFPVRHIYTDICLQKSGLGQQNMHRVTHIYMYIEPDI